MPYSARLAASQAIKACHAIVSADHHPGLDQAGFDAEPVHRLHDERIAVRPIVTATGDQPDARTVTPRHQAKAIMLRPSRYASATWTCDGICTLGAPSQAVAQWRVVEHVLRFIGLELRMWSIETQAPAG